jgi:hypothetical protein
VVTREDLSPGYQATQAVHAAVQYAVEHHAKASEWNDGGSLVVLAAKNESKLHSIGYDLEDSGISLERFREPDIDGELTAIAFLSARKPEVLSKLSLALSTPTDPRFLREREIRDSLRKEVS